MEDAVRQESGDSNVYRSRSYHDAELIGINLKRAEKSLSLEFLTVDSSSLTIGFSGVASIRATDFISQNVVSRLLLSSSNDFSEDQLRSSVRWSNSLDGSPNMITNDQIDKYVSRILSQELILFVLEPSWGAEVAIISNSVHFP